MYYTVGDVTLLGVLTEDVPPDSDLHKDPEETDGMWKFYQLSS